MAWNIIRTATATDKARVSATTARFEARHNITDPAFIDATESPKLARLWKAAVRRALNEPTADGIVQGTVGRHAR